MGKIIHYSFVLMMIAVISAGILAGVNNITKPVIERLEKSIKEKAKKEVFPEGEIFQDDKAIKVEDFNFIPVYKGEEKLGHIVYLTKGGYAGDIKFVIGIKKDGKIKGLKILDSQETPGLGANINKLEWQEIWKSRDKNYKFNKSLDAFAGATISPEAVYNETIRALSAYDKISK